jgi:GNAT superfamily N-acetyltransferase
MQRMIQIDSKQVTPVLSSLFDLDTPTCIRALAVLAGGNKGKIFTDDPACPHWGLVWEADDGTLYRGGKYGREVLSDAVALLRKEDVVALGFRDCDPSVDLFPPDPDAGTACLEFIRPIGVITQATYRKQGLATFACAFLIQLCEASGAQTYWDCARLNLGSVALARKLGFQNEREYKLLAWFDLA